MTFAVTYLEEYGVVETAHSGRVTGQELQQALAATGACADEHACKRHLMDASAVEQRGNSTLDILNVAQVLSALAPGTIERQAIVPPPSPEGRQDLHFFETAARNRGVNTRVFASRDQALARLTE